MRLGCGCVNLGSASSAASSREQIRLIHEAIDSNVRVFDTADSYGRGSSERILGRAIRHRRGEVAISTKAGYVFRPRSAAEQRARRVVNRLLAVATSRSDTGPNESSGTHGGGSGPSRHYGPQDFSPIHLRRALDESLRRLGSDYVDVYQLHGADDLHDDVVAALEDLKSEGKIRAFGVGAESLESAERCSAGGRLDVVQLAFGVLDPQAALHFFSTISTTQTQIWVRGVLAGGVLSASMEDLSSVAPHPKYRTIVELCRIADSAGIALDELAVRWVRRRPEIDTILMGFSSARHLRRNLALWNLPRLDDDTTEAVDDLLRRTLLADGLS